MDALKSTRANVPVAPFRAFQSALLAYGMGSLAVTGLFLCARRIGGALVEPASGMALGLVAVSLGLAAIAFRRHFATAAKPGLPPATSWRRTVLWAVPTCVIGCWLAGVTLGGTNLLAVVLLVGSLLAEEGWSWARFVSPTGQVATAAALVATETPRSQDAVASHTESAAAPLAGETSHAACERVDTDSLSLRIADDVADAEAEYADPTVRQSVVRRRQPEGESLAGWFRVEFVAGQRVAAAHLAICPPLLAPPQCDVEQVDGPDAQLKITQALTYGIRCEVKLDQAADEPTSVVVEFFIQADDAAACGDQSQWG